MSQPEIFEEKNTRNRLQAKVYCIETDEAKRQQNNMAVLVYQSIAWKYISTIFYVLDHHNGTKELPKII